jgi:NADH-quinone oxidoreductase subunit J
MNLLFYTAAVISVLSTLIAITRTNVTHALLYFILSLISLSIIFYSVGAHFAAALEVIVYAGAIMVMYVFVAMMLNLGKATVDQERAWLKPSMWIAPTFMAAPLLIELIWKIRENSAAEMATGTVLAAKQVGIDLFGPYVLAVELASMLLLAGLVGAFHLARK